MASAVSLSHSRKPGDLWDMVFAPGGAVCDNEGFLLRVWYRRLLAFSQTANYSPQPSLYDMIIVFLSAYTFSARACLVAGCVSRGGLKRWGRQDRKPVAISSWIASPPGRDQVKTTSLRFTTQTCFRQFRVRIAPGVSSQ